MLSFCICNLYFEFVISLVFVSACIISNILMSDIVMYCNVKWKKMNEKIWKIFFLNVGQLK